jgi:aspartate beta-hydroxylase
MFAKQQPGTGVLPHSDGRNFVLTAHLGLKIPQEADKCWMRVGGERRSWQQGKALVLDTSFVHETRNDSPEARYVLILDFWHPELTLVERAALQYIYHARNLFDAGQMESIESSYFDTQTKTSGNPFKNIFKMFGGQ